MTNPPASARRTAVKRHKVYGCRLDQDTITRLIRASADGVAPATVELTTVWNDTRFDSGSLDGLRQDIKDQFEPGDGRRLDDLEIRAGDGDRRVTLTIGATEAEVTVVSADATWARGRAGQLRDILLWARGCGHLRTWCAGRLSGLGLVAGAIVVACLATAGLIDRRPASWLVAGLIVVVSTTAGFLAGRVRARRNRTILWIDGPIPRRGWRTWTVAERLASLTLLVALGALIVNILK